MLLRRCLVILLFRRTIRFWTAKTKSRLGESEVFHVYSLGIVFGAGGVWKGQPVRSGYSEQIQSFAKIPKAEYEAVAKEFDPEKWNADSVVALAKAAGMKSIVFTSKHHDGFCMYHSKYTKYNIVDATPFKRDVMKGIVGCLPSAGGEVCGLLFID